MTDSERLIQIANKLGYNAVIKDNKDDDAFFDDGHGNIFTYAELGQVLDDLFGLRENEMMERPSIIPIESNQDIDKQRLESLGEHNAIHP